MMPAMCRCCVCACVKGGGGRTNIIILSLLCHYKECFYLLRVNGKKRGRERDDRERERGRERGGGHDTRNLNSAQKLIQQVRHSVVIQLNANDSTQISIHQLHHYVAVSVSECVCVCVCVACESDRVLHSH